MNVRTVRPGEAGLVSRIAFRSKAWWGYPAAFMRACRAELTYSEADCARLHVAVVEDPDVLGFYALERLSADDVELDALFVLPEAIGRGYGRVLWDHATQAARDMGAATMIVQGDPNAQGFYLAMGARPAGRRESASISGRYLPLFAMALARRHFAR